MKWRFWKPPKSNAQLLAEVAVLKRELEHQLVTNHDLTPEQARGMVESLIWLPPPSLGRKAVTYSEPSRV